MSVDGHRVLVYGNVPLYLNRAGDRVDLVVERNGEKFRLEMCIRDRPRARAMEAGSRVMSA